jgi:hypothetical protein
MVKQPGKLGSDAIRLIDNKFLTYWDEQITYALESPNRFLWRNVLGVKNLNSPALEKITWNYEVGPFAGNLSQYGIEPANLDILFTPVSNYFIALEATLDLDFYKLEKAKLAGMNLEAETVRAIVNKLDWMETYYLTQGCTQNTDNSVTCTGIMGFTGTQDAGNPTGAWDDPTDVYADIPTILGKLDAIGYDGPIDLVMDSGLKAKFRLFIDDGTTTFETSVWEWILKQLNGGRIYFSEYAFVDPNTQYTGLSYTGVTAGTNHYCIAIGRHPQNYVVLAHDVMPFKRKANRDVDLLRDYVGRPTLKIGSPLHIAWMDGIDEST